MDVRTTMSLAVKRVQTVLLLCLVFLSLALWRLRRRENGPQLPRLLCWVPSAGLSDKTRAVRDTWGRRCAEIVFFTPQQGKKDICNQSNRACLKLFTFYF